MSEGHSVDAHSTPAPGARSPASINLDGERLTIEDVCAVAERGAPVSLSLAASEKMQASREPVERLAAADDPIYGVNTGVGLLADIRVPRQDLDLLQLNVVRSHAAGVGPPLGRAVARAMMLIRANVLAKGFSGIRPVVAERLCDLLNRGVTPIIPEQGSVGASGDLAPLAHMALVLVGEGEAEFEGAVLPGGEALRRAGLAPLQFHPKEGLSLINGTQAMLAIGCLELAAARTVTNSADVIAALTLDALRGTPVAFDPRIHATRPHVGQGQSAARLRRLLEGSEIRQSHITCRRVQDAYSLRCIPQVHGAICDALAEAGRVFSIELNAATDNPLVFPVEQAVSPANGGRFEVLSGGNFHGEPLAFQLDFLAIAVSTLASISERRIDRLVNPALNEDLPPFLAGHAGLESGLMMAQVTAAALVAENRVLAHPACTGSITTSGNKEDFVSMGMTAALKLQRVVRNTRAVLAIETLTAARALDLLAPLRTSPPLEQARARIRAVSPPFAGDRPLHRDIAALEKLIAEGGLQSEPAS
jgi:histidine ammonia-lyase